MGCQQLLLDAADGQHTPAQRDLTGHGDIATGRSAGQRADDRGRHRDACRRSVLRRATFEDVNVQVTVLVEVWMDAELVGMLAEERDAGLRALLHDVAELSG